MAAGIDGARGEQLKLAKESGLAATTNSGLDHARLIALKEAGLNATTGATLDGARLEQVRANYIATH